MNISRKLLALVTTCALAACGGGGGSSSPVPTTPGAPAPTATPGAPAPDLATPTFTLTIPRRTSTAKGSKTPAFISSAIQSIKIELTADSAGIDPATLPGNPTISNQNSTTCGSGCTIAGPASPVGSDTYTITTYDATAAGGSVLDIAVAQTFTITKGVANNESVTLLGKPANITLTGDPGWRPGSQNGATIGTAAHGASIVLDVQDADGETITGNFSSPVFISDPDTNGDGTNVQASLPCPTSYPAGNLAKAPTEVQMVSLDDTKVLCYGGIAENPFTLSAISGAAAGFQTIVTVNHAPQYLAASGTPAGLIALVGGLPDIQLFTTTGYGSTGSVTYTESGWTEAPYNQTLGVTTQANLCSNAGPFSTYGSLSAAYDPTGTIITVSAIASPAAGSCPVLISDGLTLNGYHASGEAFSSYTTSTFGVNDTHLR